MREPEVAQLARARSHRELALPVVRQRREVLAKHPRAPRALRCFEARAIAVDGLAGRGVVLARAHVRVRVAAAVGEAVRAEAAAAAGARAREREAVAVLKVDEALAAARARGVEDALDDVLAVRARAVLRAALALGEPRGRARALEREPRLEARGELGVDALAREGNRAQSC